MQKNEKTVGANDLSKGDIINVTFKDGFVSAVVENVEVNNEF